MSVLPFDSPKSSLEKDAKLFIEEEDDLGETIDLSEEEVPAQPPIELKPLPASLRYAFLNGNKNTHVIISDKLSDEETSKLIAILEKHRLVYIWACSPGHGRPAQSMPFWPIPGMAQPGAERA